MRSVRVEEESQVAEARRVAAGYARELMFDEVDAGRVALVATELATNILKHAGRGEVILGLFEDEQGAGVQCLALDKGGGIAVIAAALRDGYSTAGSSGTGLGAIERQSQLFDIYSRSGGGTAILARLLPRKIAPLASSHAVTIGVVNLAMPGEEACGDAWSVKRSADGLSLLVVDGLGHGPLAATAAHAAIKIYEKADGMPSVDLMQRMHQALRSTRGAAASAAWLPHDGASDVVFIGIGNVAGVLVTERDTRRMVSYNGTLGHAMKSLQPFRYPSAGDATTIVLASDGLGTSWSLDAYPGLKRCHPSLTAGVLYRDFARGRDDVTVLVARRMLS